MVDSTDISARMTPEVLRSVVSALLKLEDEIVVQSPLLKIAYARSDLELSDTVRELIFKLGGTDRANLLHDLHRRESRPYRARSGVLTARPVDSVVVETFPPYVGTDDGYYVRPNASILALLTEHPMSFSAGRSVLDLGAGTGRHSIMASLVGASVDAVDASQAGIDFIKRQARELDLPNLTALREDFRSIHFKRAYYDVIIAATSLEHVSRSDRRRLLSRLTSALGVGGVLYAKVFLDDDPGSISSQGEPESSETGVYVSSYYSKNELRNDFAALDVIQYREFRWLDSSHGIPHFHSAAEIICTNRS